MNLVLSARMVSGCFATRSSHNWLLCSGVAPTDSSEPGDGWAFSDNRECGNLILEVPGDRYLTIFASHLKYLVIVLCVEDWYIAWDTLNVQGRVNAEVTPPVLSRAVRPWGRLSTYAHAEWRYTDRKATFIAPGPDPFLHLSWYGPGDQTA